MTLIIKRENAKDIFISPHMERRLKERKGFNRKAIKRHIVRALEFGETIQRNIENGASKIVKLFQGDHLIFYVEKEAIYSATVLTDKALEENTFFLRGVRKKKTCRYVLVNGKGFEDEK